MADDASRQATRSRSPTAVPGPTGVERLRVVYRILTCGNRLTEGLDPQFFTRLRDEYGPIARISLPAHPDVYVLSNPEDVGYVLEENQHNYRKCESQVADLTEVFGRGLVTADGDYWKRHKRALSPMLTRSRFTEFEDVVSSMAETTFEEWATDADSIDLADESFGLMLDILGRILFGDRFERWRDDVETDLALVQKAFPRKASLLPTLPFVSSKHEQQLARASSSLDAAIEQMIDEQRETDDERSNFLEWLVAADELTIREVRDELKTLLIAGLVLATALTWTLYSVSNHPETQAKLRERLRNGDGQTFDPSGDAPNDQSLLKRVIQESLRLYPPLPPAIRSPISEDDIGGYVVPPDSHVVVNQVQIHRDPTLWNDPLAFRPERFASGWQENKPKYSYYPFGGGGRTCIGRVFAHAILQRLLSHCVSNYELHTTTESTTEMNPIAPAGIQIDLTELT